MKSFMNNPSLRETAFFQILRKNNLPIPVKEFKFHPTRKWRFDYAFTDIKVALELEGGIWIQGRHTRPKGYKNDMEKYTEASILGWRVLRIEPKDLLSNSTIEMLKRTLAA